MTWTPGKLKVLLGFYPPYLGAGVRPTYVDPGWREIRVEMKLRWFNKNLVGTHFGGSLYSMVDPHLMIMLVHRLGPDYTVWSQSASIDFKRPGQGTVRSVIRVEDDVVDLIRAETASGAPYRHDFDIDITDEQEKIVASVNQTIYVRIKQA